MKANLPVEALNALLQDAIARDLPTARRAAIARIVLQEGFLTREQLMTRVEGLLGRGCFGAQAWEDNFYRDMRAVRAALQAAGQQLRYSRAIGRHGYYLDGQPALSEALRVTLARSLAELDAAQMDVLRQMPPAERFRLGCSVTNTARDVVAYRLRQRNPALSAAEASYQALRGTPSAAGGRR